MHPLSAVDLKVEWGAGVVTEFSTGQLAKAVLAGRDVLLQVFFLHGGVR